MNDGFPLKGANEKSYRHPAFLPTAGGAQALSLGTVPKSSKQDGRYFTQPLGWQACIGASNLGYFTNLKNMESNMLRQSKKDQSSSDEKKLSDRFSSNDLNFKVLSCRDKGVEEDLYYRMVPSVLNRLNPPRVLQALSSIPVPMSPQAKEIRSKGRLSGLSALTQGMALVSMAPSVLEHFEKIKKTN